MAIIERPEALWQRCSSAPPSKRCIKNAPRQGERGGGDAEGHPRTGRPHGGAAETPIKSAKPKEMKLADAAELAAPGDEEPLFYYVLPHVHGRFRATSKPEGLVHLWPVHAGRATSPWRV
jgi:hypothetical protein